MRIGTPARPSSAAEDDEGRRPRAHLRAVPVADRAWTLGLRLLEDAVDLARRGAARVAFVQLDEVPGQPVHACGAERRRPHHRRSREPGDLLAEILERPVALLDEVPLVRDDEERATELHHPCGEPLVLPREALASLDHQHRDVGAFDRPLGTEPAVVLDTLHASGASEAGGIHEPHESRRPGDDGVDRVACRSRLLEHDRALLSHQAVEERRLPDVRPADEREPGLMLRSRLGAFGRQERDDPVEQVAGSSPVETGHRNRLPQAERREDPRFRLVTGVVDLVRHEQDGSRRPPELASEPSVLLHGAGVRVHDEQDDIGGLGRALRLRRDEGLDAASAVEVSPGVDQAERAAAPRGLELDAVARHARHLVCDRLATAEQPVHEGRLPDVLATDEGHGRQLAHGVSSRRRRTSARTSS
jgi:hypothetical protein